MITTFERGVQEGIKEGIKAGVKEGIKEGVLQGQRQMLLIQLEARFGPLSAEVKERVEALAPELVPNLLVDVVRGKSLVDMGLMNG